MTDHELLCAESEVEDSSVDVVRGVALAPVRLGGRSLGSMALVGSLPSDQMVRAVANLIAITIEKARALEDASHAEAARQSEVLKSALLDSLAHDIKTPLTSIKAAVTSLLGSSPGAESELLTIINEEADRLNRIAAEAVEMARIEAGKLHLDKQPRTRRRTRHRRARRTVFAAGRGGRSNCASPTIFHPRMSIATSPDKS